MEERAQQCAKKPGVIKRWNITRILVVDEVSMLGRLISPAIKFEKKAVLLQTLSFQNEALLKYFIALVKLCAEVTSPLEASK